MHSVQVTNISPDELVERIISAIPNAGSQVKYSSGSGMINILNKRDAAKVLGISEKLFEKLHARACIPCTVNAGIAKNGNPICRWAEHHLQMIRPEIQKLKYTQVESHFEDSRKTISKILGV